jgi:putative phosphoesterase
VGNGAIAGLISDTHGLMRPEALQALAGSDLILHAGDVGNPGILDSLRAIAPVIAVRGNVDREPWAAALPLTAAVEVGSLRIYMLHDLQELAIDPAAEGFHLVVSGHSHKPGRALRDGVQYVNPGSAGPRRFRLPVTAARLDAGASPPGIDFVDLLTGSLLQLIC